ncbi:MAG TPA: permease, partial [Gammaproteobacteria bacterium]|nr:permease [Gammaproteobacteria bacterium]
MIVFLQNLLDLSLEAAPWLVLGLALGGLMKALIPTEFLQKHLRGEGLAAISKAALLGAPLPLCSCGVIPVALGLRKAGASKSATTSFLVSTPETGIDSISITYALMGPFMAVVRPVAALSSALVTGLLVAFFDASLSSTNPLESKVTQSGCEASPAQEPRCCSSSSACCESEGDNDEPLGMGWRQKAWEGIHYAFTRLLDDIWLWLAFGMLFAATSKTFLPPDFLAQWGQGATAMLVMLLAGIPMYICATASTPVAAGLMIA